MQHNYSILEREESKYPNSIEEYSNEIQKSNEIKSEEFSV